MEDRITLTASPVLLTPVMSPPTANEGNVVNVTFQFTDELTGSADTVGVPVASFTGLATTNGAFNLSTYNTSASIGAKFTFNTDTSQLIAWGANGTFGELASNDDVVVATLNSGSYSVAARSGSPWSATSTAYDIRVLAYTGITIPSGYTLQAIGSKPLAMLSTGNITVGGIIDVSAYRDLAYAGDSPTNNERLPGAGGGQGGTHVGPGLPSNATITNGSPAAGAPADISGFQAYGRTTTGTVRGGGGGAFGGNGGDGNFNGVAQDPLAGDAYGTLQFGAMGGSGGAGAFFNGAYVSGGGGGGGIELGAAGVITVSGSILADGGNGLSATAGLLSSGGGGGAGGGIVIHGPTVSVTGTLRAAGGDASATASNGFGGAGGGGRIYVSASNASPTSGATLNVSGGVKGGAAGYNGDSGSINIFQTVPSGYHEYDIVVNWHDGSPNTLGSTDPMGGIVMSTSGPSALGTFAVNHTFLDNTANATITVTPRGGGTPASGTFNNVSAANVAPTLTLSGAASVAEGSAYTLGLSSSDPGADTITSWTINWGDSVQVVPGNPSSVSHTYADGSASYTISATATDEDGTFAAGNTVGVSVTNVAPTLTLSGAASVNEGSPYTLNLSSSDPGADTITSWTINWGDGIQVVSGNPSSVIHTYADGAASYAISASATDEDGTFNAVNTVGVSVDNVAPTLTLSGAATVNEGSSYTLNLSSSDPGADTITSWTINWGDAIEFVSGNPSSVTHTYADGAASYAISASATDEDDTFTASNTVGVTVNNVAPTLTIGGAASVNEGSVYTLNLSSSDPGADTIASWTINWGDATEVISGNPLSVTHTYADGSASYAISATATDEDGTFSAGNTVGVTVDDVAPTLTLAGAASVAEGSVYTLNLTSSDPGADTITGWSINWGDGIQVVSGNPASVSHTYADGSASYTISATATDEDGTFPAGNTIGVSVTNVAPTLTLTGASSVNEGSPYTLTLSSSDPGADTITSWSINWGDGIQVVSGNPASVAHTYADGSASYTISAMATDEDGTYNAGNSVAVSVTNVAPTLTLSGASSVAEGSVYTLNLSSSDPGADMITSWSINWGDGIQVVSGNPSSVTHTYADGNSSSNYTITASATDEDGTFAAGNSVSVSVLNIAPTANAGGPYLTFDDLPITLHATGIDPAGAADPLTFTWDLNGNGTYGETGSAATRGDEVGANPTFNPAGLGGTTQTVKVKVSDGDGGETLATSTVQVLTKGTLLIDGVLHIVGASSNDIVLISQCSGSIVVIATFNSDIPMTFDVDDVDSINVRTRGGNDIVLTTSNVNRPMTIDGGSGNDMLQGGSGSNLILGGSGNDTLYGGSGDDVLLGGDGNDDLLGKDGNDALVGGAGNDLVYGGLGRDLVIGGLDNDDIEGGGDEDILIGGYTVHDNSVAALDAVMNIWTSSATFSARVATLTGTGGLLVGGVTVFDDNDHDDLNGGAGRDLYFADMSKSGDGVKDTVLIQQTLDSLVAVN